MTTHEHPTIFLGLPSRSIFCKQSVGVQIPICSPTYSKTGPLSEDLGVGDLDELDVVLVAESLDELEVLGYSSSRQFHLLFQTLSA